MLITQLIYYEVNSYLVWSTQRATVNQNGTKSTLTLVGALVVTQSVVQHWGMCVHGVDSFTQTPLFSRRTHTHVHCTRVSASECVLWSWTCKKCRVREWKFVFTRVIVILAFLFEERVNFLPRSGEMRKSDLRRQHFWYNYAGAQSSCAIRGKVNACSSASWSCRRCRFFQVLWSNANSFWRSSMLWFWGCAHKVMRVAKIVKNIMCVNFIEAAIVVAWSMEPKQFNAIHISKPWLIRLMEMLIQWNTTKQIYWK